MPQKNHVVKTEFDLSLKEGHWKVWVPGGLGE